MARAIAAHTRPVLSANSATPLTLGAATTTGAAPDRIDLACWDARKTVSTLWCPRRSAAALERSGQLPLAGLLLRWPANACLPGIGIVTDGHGVAFSPGHPLQGTAGRAPPDS